MGASLIILLEKLRNVVFCNIVSLLELLLIVLGNRSKLQTFRPTFQS